VRRRSRWLAVVGLVLGLVGTQVVTAGPANAWIPGLVRVSATVGGINEITAATAVCPAGKRVYGLGGEIGGANGLVHMVSLQPNPALTEVTVIAAPTVVPLAPWSVTAYGICGWPAADPVLVSATAASWGSSVACPAGNGLYGTGARHGGSPVWTLREMAPNAPAAPPTITRASVNKPAGMPGVKAVAICGTPLPTLHSIMAPFMNSSTVTCPPGELVHGTGGLIAGDDPNIVFEDIVPNAALTQVQVTARNKTTGLQEPTRAYAVCA
jgi:hypothetical protein